MSLVKCKECGHEISKNAKTCPNCGAINKKERKPLGCLSGLILFVVIIYAAGQFGEHTAEKVKSAKDQENAKHFAENKQSILQNIHSLIKDEKYEQALQQIQKYSLANDTDLTTLRKDAKEKQLLAIVKPLPASMINDNLKYYKELLELRPENSTYKAKVSLYQKKVDAQISARDARIKKYGDPPTPDGWSGGFLEVNRYLERTAHDPDSIDIVSCSEVYHNNTYGWLVRCTYRGKNGFGAVVRNTNWFSIYKGIVTIHDTDKFSF